jgi:L-fucose isomerase-like protein
MSLGPAFAAPSAHTVKGVAAPGLGGSGEKAKVRLVLAYRSPKKPIWPNIGYDFDRHNSQFVENLRKACTGIEFMTCNVMSEADAKQVLEHDKEVDGYLLYLSGCLWGRAPDVIASSGKPTVFVDHLFAGSGAFLTAYGRARRQGLKVAAVSSSRFEDVVQAAKCIETVTKLRSSKILVIGRGLDKKIEELFGTKMIAVEFSELNEAYNKADPKVAGKKAGEWMKEAQKVIEPSREEVEKSAALYLAMCELLQRHSAQAIAINCLGGFYGGHISAYPCLGFMQLNNDGFVGACEGDRKSTITMLLMAYLTGRPGYISDPVIDTAKNQVIYAHCVAPTKVFGPKGRSNRYHLRNHSEDRKGACCRSLMPIGEMTTTIMFDAGKKQVIMHQGVTVENVDEDMACRNKLAVEVKGDVYKLLNEWDRWGWHRVTFYGDHKRAVYNVAALLGFEVVEEA